MSCILLVLPSCDFSLQIIHHSVDLQQRFVFGIEVNRSVSGKGFPPLSRGHKCESLRLNRHARFLDVFLNVPIDKGRLSRRVVADKHHGDFFPRREQVFSHRAGYPAESVLAVRVDFVTFPQNFFRNRLRLGRLFRTHSFKRKQGLAKCGAGRKSEYFDWPKERLRSAIYRARFRFSARYLL